jgi:hypothetical protein
MISDENVIILYTFASVLFLWNAYDKKNFKIIFLIYLLFSAYIVSWYITDKIENYVALQKGIHV